jgi:biopolymer transport protein ExbD
LRFNTTLSNAPVVLSEDSLTNDGIPTEEWTREINDDSSMKKRLTERRDKFFDAKNPDNRLNVVLRLDKSLTIQQMVDVMEIGANLGIRMVLATDKSRQ